MKVQDTGDFTLHGTGKNEGRVVTAFIESCNMYSVVMRIRDPKYAKDKKTFLIYRSTGQTTEATKGQTSWRVDADQKQRLAGA